MSVVWNSTYVDAGATAVDIVDGDLTSRIAVANFVDTTVSQDYVVMYTVADSTGNLAQKSRTVTVGTVHCTAVVAAAEWLHDANLSCAAATL